jgi:RNA polymerase sigma factor (sigma-70 family)
VDQVLATGDERAFRELYRRHTGRAFQMALRLLDGDRAEAEDVLQQAWLAAGTRLGTFQWHSSFSTWLIAIVVNLSRDAVRRAARPIAAIENEPAAPPAALGDRIDLDRAIAQLPEGCRTILVLHDLEGLTHQEISTRLGIAPGTSKSQLFAARRALRSLLMPLTEGDGPWKTTLKVI